MIDEDDHLGPAIWVAAKEAMAENFNISKESFYGAQEYVPVGELERLRAALDDIFEMWAGSEGFIPHTAPEGYLLELIKKMADRAALAKMEESK